MLFNHKARALVILLGVGMLAVACGAAIPGPASSPLGGSTPAPEPGPLPSGGTETAPAPGDATSPLPTPKPVLTEREVLPGEVAPAPTPDEPPVTGEAPPALLTAVTADLQARLGVSAETITVVRDQAVTWPDGSLGCPEPGMAYTQALVDGYWVVLAQGGREYDYRSGRAGFFILCEQAGRSGPVPSDPRT